MSLSSILRKRELGLGDRSIARKKYPKNHRIPFRAIITDELMLEGHILMGFSADGNHVMSYNQLSDDVESQYYLHFWKFNFQKKLTKVHSVRLFASEAINPCLELRISIHQTTGSLVMVVGSYSQLDKLSKNSCVSILPTPPSNERCHSCSASRQLYCLAHSFAMHFRLLNCSALPSTEAKEVISPAADTFVFNTAVSLVAIQVSAGLRAGIRGCADRGSDSPSSSPASCCAGVNDSRACHHPARPFSAASGAAPSAAQMPQAVASHDGIPVLHCSTSSREACESSATPSSLLTGHVRSYMACPDQLDTTQEQDVGDYEELAMHLSLSNATPLQLFHTHPPVKDLISVVNLLQVTQHTLDLEEYIQYVMLHHTATADRFRGISDYVLRTHHVDDAVVGSLAILVEAWEEMEEQSPFDFDYVPMAERHRISSTVEGLVFFEWKVQQGILRTLDVTLLPTRPPKSLLSKPSEMRKKLLARSLRALSVLSKIFVPRQPPVLTNNSWFHSGASVAELRHPHLPFSICLN